MNHPTLPLNCVRWDNPFFTLSAGGYHGQT